MAECKRYMCRRKRTHDRYCRQHHEDFTREPIALVVEPLDRSLPEYNTYGNYLRGCIEQYKKKLRS